VHSSLLETREELEFLEKLEASLANNISSPMNDVFDEGMLHFQLAAAIHFKGMVRFIAASTA